MSKKKNSIQLRYVKGTCELEVGVVKFVGSMSSVSNHQAWYYTIYAIKDKFPEIDYWINPIMEECRGLTSRDDKLREEVRGKFNCKFEPFPNGEIRPKKKLSEVSKKIYAEQRAKVDLGVKVEWEDEIDVIPCTPTSYICGDGIRSSMIRNSLNVIERDLICIARSKCKVEELKKQVHKVESLLGVDYNFKDDYMLRIIAACEELRQACNEIVKEYELNDAEKGMYYTNIIMICDDFINRVKLRDMKKSRA